MKFWKKKKPFSKLELGVDVKRCMECTKYVRPCLADDKPATFHRWVDETRGLLHINALVTPIEREMIYRDFQSTGVAGPHCSIEPERNVFALVEYPDGSVGKVKPELIQFLDRKGDDW